MFAVSKFTLPVVVVRVYEIGSPIILETSILPAKVVATSSLISEFVTETEPAFVSAFTVGEIVFSI